MPHPHSPHSDPGSQELMTLLRETEDLAQVLSQRQDDFLHRPFAAHLALLMREQGLTIGQLGEMSLLSRSFTYQLCSGVRAPGRDIVIRLALALKLDLQTAQALLRSAQRGELYPRVRRDAILIHCIAHGRTLADTDEILQQWGEIPIL